MRRIAIAGLFLLFSFGPAQAVPVFVENPDPATGATNLITNGSFEAHTGIGTEPTGWNSFFTHNGVWRISDEQSILGTYSVKTNSNNFSGPGYSLDMSVATIPGAEYILSAYFYADSITTANVYVDTADRPTDPNLGAGVDFTPDSWVFGYDTFTASSTTSFIRLVVDGFPVTSDQVMYIDGIGLTLAEDFVADAEEVSEPGAFAVFGIGIAGLIGLRKRRRKNP